MKLDRRDPEKLGQAYRRARAEGVSIALATRIKVDEYRDGPFMSADPGEHHSKTRQDIPLHDGGE